MDPGGPQGSKYFSLFLVPRCPNNFISKYLDQGSKIYGPGGIF